MRLPPEIEKMMWEMEVQRRDRLASAAKADPVRHKKTLVWPDGGHIRIRYYGGGVDRRGVRRRFSYTTTRNAAGYFLSFVETFNTKTGKGARTKFVASRKRHLMDARAKRLWQAHSKR